MSTDPNFRRGPVFVVGCPRSGTTLLYHMLISAGDFVNYRAESHVFNIFALKYGAFDRLAVRRRFMDDWVQTDYFAKTGLDREAIRRQVVENAESWGDFLRIVMEAMADQQQVPRWAECTPHHVLHLREIANSIPGAAVVHMIRDGRDAALSMDRLNWINNLPLDQNPSVLAAAAYWSWIVGAGRTAAARSGLPYVEIRFEELVRQPRRVLAELSEFLDQELDYDRIQQNAVGSVSRPNSSFDEKERANFNPVGRWRRRMPAPVLELFENRFGARLEELGYPLATTADPAGRSTYERLYSAIFSAKQLAKTRTPLRRVLVRTLMGDGQGRTRNVMEARHPPGASITPEG